MKNIFLALAALVAATVSMPAQSLEDLNVQIHGYATQGFLYTTKNNILSMNSSDGSPSWTEAVVNVSSLPIPKLRIAVQARYFLLGNYGNAITLDWASADYKVNDRIGFRFGKVKIPWGQFNEIQDIDPAYLWCLLPQSVYPITSRNSYLAQYGGVVYGTFGLPSGLGKMEYRGWSGENTLVADDGALLFPRENGTSFPNGLSGLASGAALHWKTPLQGLMVGASDIKYDRWVNSATAAGGTIAGNENVKPYNLPSYFAGYEKGRIMVAYEYARKALTGQQTYPFFTIPFGFDNREQYAMASYKITNKFAAGAYYSYFFNQHLQNVGTNFQKDYAIAGRYDLGQFLYAKAEQHFINGEALGYDNATNPNGLKPNTKLTVLKVGVSF
jgi:hypothetical protein